MSYYHLFNQSKEPPIVIQPMNVKQSPLSEGEELYDPVDEKPAHLQCYNGDIDSVSSRQTCRRRAQDDLTSDNQLGGKLLFSDSDYQ